jgi:hypothetical protein
MEKNKIEKTPEKTKSAANLESIDPEIWDELSHLSVKEQDALWFPLTQKHLREYKEGKNDTDEFRQDELKLIFLHQIGAETRPQLDPAMKQRGFSFDDAERLKKFEQFGDFMKKIKGEIEKQRERSNEPVYIMVSGIGISGKATLRNVLTRELIHDLPSLRVVAIDRDYEKIFPPQIPADVYLVEDVHGLDAEKDEHGKYGRLDGIEGAPDGFGMVVYALSPAATYKKSLVQRGASWIRMGKIDLTAITHDKEQKEGNIVKKTADELKRTLGVGRDWFREQLKVLRDLKNRGTSIMVVDPTELFKTLYGFEDDPNLVNKDFETALTEALEK